MCVCLGSLPRRARGARREGRTRGATRPTTPRTRTRTQRPPARPPLARPQLLTGRVGGVRRPCVEQTIHGAGNAHRGSGRRCGVRVARVLHRRTSRIGDSQQQLMGSGGELEPPATAASARPATHHAPSAAHVGNDAARASRCARDACAASMRARRTRSEPAGRAVPTRGVA